MRQRPRSRQYSRAFRSSETPAQKMPSGSIETPRGPQGGPSRRQSAGKRSSLSGKDLCRSKTCQTARVPTFSTLLNCFIATDGRKRDKQQTFVGVPTDRQGHIVPINVRRSASPGSIIDGSSLSSNGLSPARLGSGVPELAIYSAPISGIWACWTWPGYCPRPMRWSTKRVTDADNFSDFVLATPIASGPPATPDFSKGTAVDKQSAPQAHCGCPTRSSG